MEFTRVPEIHLNNSHQSLKHEEFSLVLYVPRSDPMRAFLLFALMAACRVASAQIVSIGALGGVPITDTTGRTDQSRPYIVGGSVEIHFVAGLAVEADALYRRVGNTSYFGYSAGPNVFGLSVDRRRGNSWEFPLLGKYYFRRASAWQPFLGTGFAFRTIGVSDSLIQTPADSTGAPQTHFQGSFREPLEVGAVVEGGLRFHYRRLAILPQIRYTRWGGSNDLTRNNETSFLLGLSF